MGVRDREPPSERDEAGQDGAPARGIVVEESAIAGGWVALDAQPPSIGGRPRGRVGALACPTVPFLASVQIRKSAMAQAMDLPEAETPPEAAARAPAVVRVPLRRPAVPADRVVRVPLSLMEYGRPIPARAAHGQDGARADEASRPLQAAPATEDVAAEQGAAGVRSSIGRSPSARLWAAVGAVLIVLAGAALYLVLRSSGAEGGLVRESAVQRKIAY